MVQESNRSVLIRYEIDADHVEPLTVDDVE